MVRPSRRLRHPRIVGHLDEAIDRLWQQRWDETLAFYNATGDWPKANSTDPWVKSLARWIAFQRRQHRDQRLNPERVAMVRTGGVRFNAFRSRESDDDAGEPT